MLVELPNDLLGGLSDYCEKDLNVDVAALLYHRKVLTLARAMRWVGMTPLEFQKALADRGFTINYTIEDFDLKFNCTSVFSH